MDLIYTAMFVYLPCSSSTKAAAVGEAVEAAEELATGGCAASLLELPFLWLLLLCFFRFPCKLPFPAPPPLTVPE